MHAEAIDCRDGTAKKLFNCSFFASKNADLLSQKLMGGMRHAATHVVDLIVSGCSALKGTD